jgi:peptidoglycan pentaglycine glycine transferase (the first glycine)
MLCTYESWSITIERRKIVGKYTWLYILWVEPELITEEFLSSIKRDILKKTDLFLQIEPINDNEQWTINNERISAPFRRFLEPTTATLNLRDQDEEGLLTSFAEKGRYNIRLAQKRGVETRWVKGNQTLNVKRWMLHVEISYIEAFFDLLQETTSRDGFSGNSLAYYQHFVETLEKNNAGGLLVAEKDWILHAAGIFAYWGDTAIYYYGASSSDPAIRRDMATYLLQWDAIREGKKRECKTYDFLWISPDGKGKLAGVTEFKLRFNPEKVELPAEIVVIYKPNLLKILQIVSKIRKLFTQR